MNDVSLISSGEIIWRKNKSVNMYRPFVWLNIDILSVSEFNICLHFSLKIDAKYYSFPCRGPL